MFAAASLTDAFEAIADEFTTRTGTRVVLNFAASSDLATQIEQGAPADVFASADEANMTRLQDAELVRGEPEVFATNALEITVEPGNPMGIEALDDLADDDLVLVLCAPEVPCGSYARDALRKAGLDPEVDSNEADVKAVLTRVSLGEADAGLVYATDVIAAGDAVEGVPIPPEQNVIASYPIAHTSSSSAADAFIELVLSPTGARILAEHGFTTP